MNRTLIGSFYPGVSPLYRFDARAKLLCFALLIAAIVCTRAAVGYVAVCAVAAAVIWASGLPLGVVFGAFRRLWQFLLVIFIMNALFFSAERPLWRWWILSLSVEGIAQGVRVVVNVMLLVVLGNVLLGTTRPMEITNALSSLLRPLKYIGVPVQDVSMILTVAIRFIPALLLETDKIRLAQTARGAQFDSRRLLDRARSALPLVVPIFITAFKRAEDLAQAMEARGYRGEKGRTVHKNAKLGRADCVAVLLCAVVFLIQLSVFR